MNSTLVLTSSNAGDSTTNRTAYILKVNKKSLTCKAKHIEKLCVISQ